MAFLKSVLLAASCGLAASLNAGDCAFVGIYGDQDDFAMVLMEDANGESIFLTEGLPSEKHFKVGKFVEAKQHVSEAKRGAVLKKSDFLTGSTSLVALLALTAFKGSAESPEVLCSINLDGQAGAREENTVMLGSTETAEYAGSTSGSKEELLAGIGNPQNWLRNAAVRKLQGFSIAKGNETTTTMTTMMNTTMGMTTTMMDTTMMDTTMMTTTEATAVQVPGCIGFTTTATEIPEGADMAFAEAIAETAGKDVTASMVQEISITMGSCARRLASMDRRLQDTWSVNYVIKFPASVTNAAEVAATAKANIEAVTVEALTTTITAKMEAASITGFTVTATSSTVSEPEVLIDEEEPPTSKAAFASAACGLLAILSM